MAVEEYYPSNTRPIHSTKVDFQRRVNTNEIHIVQYDKDLPIIKVHLKMDLKDYSLPPDAIVMVRWGKPDGTFVYKSVLGCNKTRTIIYFEVDKQMSSEPGAINPILELTVSSGAQAGSSAIPVIIDRNPIQDGAVESEVKYSAVSEAAEQSIASASEAAKYANATKEIYEKIVGKDHSFVKYIEHHNTNLSMLEIFRAFDEGDEKLEYGTLVLCHPKDYGEYAFMARMSTNCIVCITCLGDFMGYINGKIEHFNSSQQTEITKELIVNVLGYSLTFSEVQVDFE